MDKKTIITEKLRGQIINDTLEDYNIYAIPLTKTEYEKNINNENVIIKRIKIKSSSLIGLMINYTKTIEKCFMPDKPGKTYNRKFFYTNRPLDKNHIKANSSVKGHYGNLYIAHSLVANAEVQFNLIKTMLGSPYAVLFINIKK